MPHLNDFNKAGPLWREWDRKAQKKGIRNTVYSTNGDEYSGEWDNNKKDGKGTYRWKASGAIYDGDWKEGKRCGFGTYSIPSRTGATRNSIQGYGTHFYSDQEYYEGEWYADRRSGWGRMYYGDGSIYEGEWYDDQRSGQGLLRLPSENRYEGSWARDMKNGPGKFYYLDKGQVYSGTWLEDVPKCGEVSDLGRDTAPDATVYPLPRVELAAPGRVLQEAEAGLHTGAYELE